MKKAISVKLLNEYINREFSTNPILTNIDVEGEIINLRHSKYTYFDLKEGEDIINAVDFNNILTNFQNGDKVIISGYVTSYSRGSRYQIVSKKAVLSGQGQAHLKLLKLKDQLYREGLFKMENKLSIPTLPGKIGLITSEKGAAIDDFIHVMEELYPLANLYIYPSQVQGNKASNRIVNAIKQINKTDIDLIIITRGGGSEEDLSLFNNEEIVRSIYMSDQPVITAIGHKRDETLSDLAADLSVSTPTKAAEIVAKSLQESIYSMNLSKNVIKSAIKDKINNFEYILNGYNHIIESNHPYLSIIAEENTLKINKLRESNVIKNKLNELESLIYSTNQIIQTSFTKIYGDNSYRIKDEKNSLLSYEDLTTKSNYYLESKSRRLKIRIMEFLDE